MTIVFYFSVIFSVKHKFCVELKKIDSKMLSRYVKLPFISRVVMPSNDDSFVHTFIGAVF